MQLTSEQQGALDSILEWSIDRRDREFTLGGLAGTGKTTLIKEILNRGFKATVVAPSGKAASVLRSKGITHARTIHSAAYSFKGEDASGAPQFEFHGQIAEKILVVDESSMVDARIVRDLRQIGCKILWVGDHGQLEPVGEDPGLMKEPRIRLETVMRQALENPIVRFAHALRVDSPWEKDSDPRCTIRKKTSPDELALLEDVDQIICGYNALRHEINFAVRRKLKRTKVLCKGDRVICLRNDYATGVYNGEIGTVSCEPSFAGKGLVTFSVVMDGDDVEVGPVSVPISQFGTDPQPKSRHAMWDYAYAITCHKAQGSEWRSVAVVEPGPSWDLSRWSYTAATRAREKLVFFTDRSKYHVGSS